MPERRGRPRSTLPTGEWDDDEVDALIAEVASVVEPQKERSDDALATLSALASRVLAKEPTSKQRERLRALLYGRLESRWEVDEAGRTQPSKASAIARQLVAWRYGLNVRDVRWMQETLRKARHPADRNKNKGKRDLTGQAILHRQTGQPMLDANGQPAKQTPRPRVKMIYR